MAQILLIEDELVNQMLLKQTLQRQGYEVTVASDGAMGLKLAQEHKPAMIICDWMMPQLSGLEVCAQVKSDPSLVNTFFILLTARNKVEDRVQGLDTGADDFVTKPVDPTELNARVRAGMRLHESAEAQRQLAQSLQEQQTLMASEMLEAANYVTSLLPKPLQTPVQVQSRFLPSQHLGGDCFDFYWLDDDHLVIYLLDVSGHGLGSALPSVSMQHLLRSQSLPKANLYEPHTVLTALNQVFQMGQQNPRFFTMWYGIYSHKDNQLKYASAGHPPAIVLAPQQEIQQVGQTGRLPIGVLSDALYVTDQCILSPGSCLYLFSDGIYELENADGSVWKLENFIQVLQAHDDQDLDMLMERVLATAQAHSYTDDCSLVEVKIPA